jgi:ParB-like chromosome segregation protein Spo0J
MDRLKVGEADVTRLLEALRSLPPEAAEALLAVAATIREAAALCREATSSELEKSLKR